MNISVVSEIWWSLDSRGSYSARKSRSSNERVLKVFVDHIMKEEVEKQENEKKDEREAESKE